MKLLPIIQRWLGPIFWGATGIVAGFAAFHPGWTRAPALTDGSPGSFERTARQIDEGDLLARASSKERVGWLLETCKQPSSLRRDRALYHAIQHLQPGDFLLAIADLQTLSKEFGAMGNSMRGYFAEACMERWMDVDEGSALRWLTVARGIVETDALGLPAISNGDLSVIYRVVARRNPAWALAEVKKLGEKTGRSTGMEMVAYEAACLDSRGTREWLRTLEGTPDWSHAFKGYLWSLSQSDPTAALEMVTSRGGDLGNELRSSVMLALAKSPATLKELLAKPDSKFGPEWTAMALAMMEPQGDMDPLTFLQEKYATAQALGDPGLGDGGWNWAMPSLYPAMQRDPVRTMEWVQSLDGENRERMIDSALTAWARHDPGAMMEWIAKTPGTKVPGEIDTLVQAVHQSPDRVSQWMASLQDSETRNRLSLAVAKEFAGGGDIAQALRVLPESAGDQREFEWVAASIGRNNPSQAREFSASMPDGAAKAQVIKGVVESSVNNQPAVTAKWVETLPSGIARDTGVLALATSFITTDADAAAGWLEQIEEPNLREQAAAQCYSKLLRKSAPKARTWIANFSGVSDEAKQRILAER